MLLHLPEQRRGQATSAGTAHRELLSHQERISSRAGPRLPERLHSLTWETKWDIANCESYVLWQQVAACESCRESCLSVRTSLLLSERWIFFPAQTRDRRNGLPSAVVNAVNFNFASIEDSYILSYIKTCQQCFLFRRGSENTKYRTKLHFQESLTFLSSHVFCHWFHKQNADMIKQKKAYRRWLKSRFSAIKSFTHDSTHFTWQVLSKRNQCSRIYTLYHKICFLSCIASTFPQ